MKLFELFAILSMDASKFDSGVDAAKKKMEAFSTWTNAKSVALGNMMTGLMRKTGEIAGNLLKTGFSYNSQIEDYEANFKVLLGSAEAAVAKVEALKTMAAKTPFGMEDLAGATQTLLSFQVESGKTQDVLQMLGDIALGDKNKLSGLALVFGQVSSAGKLTGQDLMQFINQGFNPLNYIAERTGESMEALRDRMSKGKVTIEEVEQAMIDATSEGGAFFEGMETASQTTSGLLSTLKDDATALLGKLIAPFTKLVKSDIIPGAQAAIASISAALDKVFGSSESAQEGLESLFGTGEEHEGAQAESAQSWYDRLMTIWADGKKEDDAQVQDFLDSLNLNTETILTAMADRRTKLEEDGKDTSALDSQITEIEGYYARVQQILTDAQGRKFTAEEVAELSSIAALLTQAEATLTGTEGASAAESQMGKLGDAIAKAGQGIADLILNWDSFKEKAKTAVEITVSFLGGSAITKGLLALGITTGPIGLIATLTIYAALQWPTDEEMEQAVTSYTGKQYKFTDKFSRWLFNLGLPTADDWDTWITQAETAIKEALFAKSESMSTWFSEFWNGVLTFDWGAWINQAWEGLKTEFSNLGPKIQSWFVWWWNGMIESLGGGSLNFLKIEVPEEPTGGGQTDGAGGGRKAIADTEGLQASVDSAGDAADALGASTSTASTSVGSMGSAAGNVASALKSAEAKINSFNPRTGGGGETAGTGGGRANALGGIFAKSTFFPSSGNIVGEAGAEAVLPLKTLWTEMSERFDMALRSALPVEQLAAAMAAQPIALNVGDRTLAQATRDATARVQAQRAREVRWGYGRGN